MDNFVEGRIGRFDQVRILTSLNVSYLSAPAGVTPSPKGIWSVAAVLNGSELLCVRNSIIIRIPATDVLKVADFNIGSITQDFGRLSHGKETS